MRRYLIPYWWLRVRTPRFPHSKAGEAGHGAQRLSQDLERMVAPDFASPEHRASRASPHPGAPGQTAFAPSGNKKRNPRDHHPPPHRLLVSPVPTRDRGTTRVSVTGGGVESENIADTNPSPRALPFRVACFRFA